MRISAALKTDPLALPENPAIKWFAARACVVRGEAAWAVFIGGARIGSFSRRDTARRNAILLGLAEDPRVHLGRLAEAFGVTSETLRLLRRLNEMVGLAPVLARKRGGSTSRVTAAIRRRIELAFEAGASISEAHAALPRGTKLSRSTVVNVRKEWQKKQVPREKKQTLTLVPPVQGELALAPGGEASGRRAPLAAAATPTEAEQRDGRPARAVTSATSVQHLGTWLMVAEVESLGLYERAIAAAQGRVSAESVRLALDALVAALSLGEQCVEGVRRLATPSASALLVSKGAPSVSWTRRTMDALAQEGGAAALQLGMVRRYLEDARLAASGTGPVFYIDNHLRPYTGKYTLRKGWRMQDKRVTPGASDYYLHDEDGRPLGRITEPAHGSLTNFLTPLARRIRLALPEETILLAFDRAGAFPTQMAELREEGFEFVTYERKPYETLPSTYFTETLDFDGERVGVSESKANLGKGRGRVRRISLRMEDGHQVNLVAVSKRSARELVEIMRGRWKQENAFKHGVERWGINQLDSRRTTAYPPDTVVPNPARRRLDRALQIARVDEGLARAALARLAEGDNGRERLEKRIAEAIEAQRTFEAQRPSTPVRAPLEETELAGKLVHHELEYKMVLDIVRIACANAECELAAELGVFLPRPAEAKKTLANLLAAPGRIHASAKDITVTLEPAGTKRELEAFAAMLKQVNQARLRHPADQTGRPLRFRLAQIS